VLWERDTLLLERLPTDEAAPAVQPQPAATFALGAWEPLPDPDADVRIARLDVRPSLLGRLASLALRGPTLALELRLADGRLGRFRVAPGLVGSPFVLDPLVTDTADLLRLYDGAPLPRVVALRVAAEQPWAWQEEATLALVSRDDLPPPAARTVDAALRADARATTLAAALAPGPGARVVADDLVEARRFRGRDALLLPRGGRLALALDARPRTLTLRCGLLPRDEHDDEPAVGGSLVVRRLRPDAAPEELLRAALVAEASGARGEVLQLQLAGDATSTLEITADGGGAWLAQVRLAPAD
jgi:hypothetical protein